MFRRIFVVVLLLVQSIPSNAGIRDCSGIDEFDEKVSCHFDQVGDHVQNMFNSAESKKYDDQWSKFNRDLDKWADKQEKVAKKIIRNIDHTLNKIQNRGPVAALLADLTRIIGVVVALPFTITNMILHDIFGLSKFWSFLLAIF